MRSSLSVRRAVFGVSAIAFSLLRFNSAQAQDSRWAPADDPTAKSLIDWERQWAEDACTHNGIQKTILAEDFHGTAPDGSLYSKQKEVAGPQNPKTTEEACAMYDVKVHFFGDAMAILYGSESAVHVEADGRRHTVKLTWTDTWLKRHGTWQIVAAQDMPSEMN
jgi:Domain of unknown function (DUF4440)